MRTSAGRRKTQSTTSIFGQMLLLLVGGLFLAGCQKETQTSQATSAGADAPPAKTTVPLRVWFVGDQSNHAIIQRQWQAASERPLELRMLTSDQLVEGETCQSDVVVFPAHLIGELIARQWLVELPAGLSGAGLSSTSSSSGAASVSATSDDQTAGAVAASGDEAAQSLQPAAWLDQTRYGRKLWGRSLGATTPVIMSNFELALPSADADPPQSAPDGRAYWQAAIEALSARASGKKNDHPALNDGDLDAVCDRFLVVLTSISRRESRFGALLDPETLKARLAEQEFVDAAEIILKLHQLSAAPQAMAGSYESAWQSLDGDEPCLSIGVPPLPTPEVDRVTSIVITPPPTSPGLSGARSAMSERTMGWNSGHGRVASLTTQCRQTGLAVEFMRWLGSESTRNALARSVDGISAATIYAPGSSAWQAQRLGHRIAQQPRLPNEPRLPGSAQYRHALGQQLLRMLNGELEPEAALQAAAAAWDEITARRDHQELRASYEASLGL